MALTAALLATSEGVAEGSNENILIPATPELIYGAIAFVIVFGFLVVFAFPRAKRALNEREERIKGSLEGAESSRAEADKLLDDYRSKLAEARSEANMIIEEARKTAESMRTEILAKGEEERSALVARAQEEIDAARVAAIAQVREEAAGFSVDLAERIVKKSIDRDAQARLVEEYIAEVERMSTSTSTDG